MTVCHFDLALFYLISYKKYIYKFRWRVRLLLYSFPFSESNVFLVVLIYVGHQYRYSLLCHEMMCPQDLSRGIINSNNSALLDFSYRVSPCTKKCMWHICLLSCQCLYDFSCLDLQHMRRQPYIVDCHRVNVSSWLPLMHCSTQVNFLYSCLSDCLTLVHRNTMAFCISCVVRLHKYNSFATRWWNSCAFSSGSFFALSLTVNRSLAAGVFAVPCISNGSSVSIFSMKSYILKLTFQYFLWSIVIPRYSRTFPLFVVSYIYFPKLSFTVSSTNFFSTCDIFRSSSPTINYLVCDLVMYWINTSRTVVWRVKFHIGWAFSNSHMYFLYILGSRLTISPANFPSISMWGWFRRVSQGSLFCSADVVRLCRIWCDKYLCFLLVGRGFRLYLCQVHYLCNVLHRQLLGYSIVLYSLLL